MKLSSILVLVTAALPLLTVAYSPTTVSTVRSIAKRDLVSTILDDIEDDLTCDSCEALLVVLKVLADLGDDAFVDTIVTVCEAAGIDDDDVCSGSIGLEGPILAQDLRGMTVGTKTSTLFCLTIFGLCQWPAVEEYTVAVTPKPSTSRPAPSGESPIQIVHISDIHVDLSYETGANFNCTKPICCRPYTAADEPGATEFPAGPFGNHLCDAPLDLEQSMYAAIRDIVPDRNFTIFTGDVVEAFVWGTTDDEVGNDLNDAFGNMKGLGQYYGAVGNHDTSPINSWPPPTVNTTISSQFALNNMSIDWAPFIGSTAAAQVKKNFGSYSVLDNTTGLRIISINTNYWYKQNFWLFTPTMERDPTGLLAWMVTELEAAEAAGERVWIMGHMPTGASDCFHDQSEYFDQIIQRFEATISALFFGHTHQDQFQLAYSNYTDQSAATANMVGYIAPALTPTSGNPTFRVYSVDPVTFAVLDFSVYYTNITSPTFQDGPTWEFLYSAKETYGPLLNPPMTDPLAELTPAFWHNLTVALENDDDLFQAYYLRRSRGFFLNTCTGDCVNTTICDLRALQSQFNCDTVSPGINFKSKRDMSNTEVATPHKDECSSSKIIPVMAAMSVSDLRNAIVSTLGAGVLNQSVPADYYTSEVTL